MNERDELILKHMLEDARDVSTFSKSVDSYKAFCQEPMVRKAIVMSMLNIGELANHLSQDFISSHPELPWKKMVGMRNLAAHGYHTLHLDIVWDTSRTTVLDLLSFLQEHFAAKTEEKREQNSKS